MFKTRIGESSLINSGVENLITDNINRTKHVDESDDDNYQ